MNKILLSKNGRNHIRIFPLKGIIELPEDGAEKIKLCQKIFVELQQSDEAIKHAYYRHTKKGYQVSVWELNKKIYLVNCIRDMDYNYVTTIYISDNLNDMLGIANFLKDNIEEIMRDYKNQIIEGQEAYQEYIENQREPKEIN